MKKIALLILLALTAVACGDPALTDNVTNGKVLWGYYSTYTGKIIEAQLASEAERKAMAIEIQPVIDMANKLAISIPFSLSPDIIYDNSSARGYRRQDNSTCWINNAGKTDNGTTYRRYYQYYYQDYYPNDFQYVEFKNYCRQFDLVSQNKVTVNYMQNMGTVGAKTWSTLDNASQLYYYIFLEDITVNIAGKIEGHTGSVTPFGILERRGPVGNIAASNFRIGVDLPQTDGTINRMDVTFTGTSPSTKQLKYYNAKYGYVTVDIDQPISFPIHPASRITYKFGTNGSKTCTFTVSYLNDPYFYLTLAKDCYNSK